MFVSEHYKFVPLDSELQKLLKQNKLVVFIKSLVFLEAIPYLYLTTSKVCNLSLQHRYVLIYKVFPFSICLCNATFFEVLDADHKSSDSGWI